MSVLQIEKLDSGSTWALWHIKESEAQLASMLSESCPADIHHPQKRLEWLAGRILLRKLTEDEGFNYQGTGKDEFGKPELISRSHHISFSHSYPLVAVQIDSAYPVGIDVEQPKEKLRTIAHRVFSPEEIRDAGNDLVKLCIYWAAKEALYKYYGKRQLLFTDHLRVQPFSMSTRGTLKGSIRLPAHEISVSMGYLVRKEFVVVFTHHSAEI